MRIKFVNTNIKHKFFDLVKNKLNKNWKEIREDFNLPKSTLESYIYGRLSLPEKLFLEFISLLDKPDKEFILQNIEKVLDNHGAVKGGKNAYLINIKKFEKGRRKGLVSIKKNKKMQELEIKETILNINITPEICEVIGAFIGDGFFNCYNNKLYQIEFAGDSRFDLDYYNHKIIPILINIFPDINPHIYKVKNKNSLRIIFYSKKLFCFLRDIFGFIPGRKTHIIAIPSLIMKEKSFVYPTIRGIFDTDGGVYFDKRKGYNKPYPRIILQTVSKNLYAQLLEYLLKEFRIYSRYNQKRNIYILEIYGHNNLKKWLSLIGFSNKRHLNKIASVA